QRAKRQVPGAGRVAGGDAGARVGLASFEARAATGIDPRQPDAAEQLLLGDDLVPHDRLESRLARRRFAVLGWTRFGAPFLEATVEDRGPFGTEMAEHEPAARRGADRGIV